LDVSLWVENIADKRSRVSQQFDRVLGGRLFFTRPRTFGLNASYAF
jgi:outer membrane receptor protein involved in Fe transport